MVIRNSIKGIIIKETKLLVNKLRYEGDIMYTLPGGKQESDELMLDALKREVMEETGFIVEPRSLLFIREGFRNHTDEPDVHRIEFMFICDIVSDAGKNFIEYDEHQIGVHWLNIDNILYEPLYPENMRQVIKNYYLGKSSPIYLGEMK